MVPYSTDVVLPEPTVGESVFLDFSYLDLTLGDHPLKIMREDKQFERCLKADELFAVSPNRFVQVAGLVTCRQRPSTSTGVVFLTLEDETGNASVVVWRTVLERFRSEILQGQLIRVKGVVEREGDVIHVVAGQVVDFSEKLTSLTEREPRNQTIVRARNFH